MFFQNGNHRARAQIAGAARVGAADEKKVLSFIEGCLGQGLWRQADPLRQQKENGKRDESQPVYISH
jgi:hypothetical protein